MRDLCMYAVGGTHSNDRPSAAACMFFFFFSGRKGCASVSRQRSKKEGRKKRSGREVKERDPHPSLLLQALIGKYLYFLNFQVSAKGVGYIYKKNTWMITSTCTTWVFYPPSAFSIQLSSSVMFLSCRKVCSPKDYEFMRMHSTSTLHNSQITTQIKGFF